MTIVNLDHVCHNYGMNGTAILFALQSLEEAKERISKGFDQVDLSVSSYDTAWVAMVPSPTSPNTPCFPQCFDWLLHNQHCDGSWGLNHGDSLFMKDSLSCTLACILALKRWGVGEEAMSKGLHYMESNFRYATLEKHHSPIGFDIIFPGMIEHVRDLNLNIALDPADVIALLGKRDLELERLTGSRLPGSEAYLVYVSEGLRKLQDQKIVMKYQRKNGSLFNSPSTTAAVSTHLPNFGCLNYLQSVLNKTGSAVPTVYPLDIYARLCMVDTLMRMGIDRYFIKEIENVLDTTYRLWVQRQEEIVLDASTCCMAFRLLRIHGYSVSPDPLEQFASEKQYVNSFAGHLEDMHTVLELQRASQVITRPEESFLKNINAWSAEVLKKDCIDDPLYLVGLKSHIRQEVEDALKFPFHTSLQRLESKRYIKIYNARDVRVLKTSYCCTNNVTRDMVWFAAEDFNICQSMLQREFKCLERWVTENRLDKLNFARQKLAYCYFSAAATLVGPELSDARLSWAKNGVLTTVVDDFYDVGGSKEEHENLLQLVEKWNVNVAATDSCSEDVGILFSAIHGTILEIGEKARKWQSHDVTSHIIEVWLDLLKSMSKEAEWQRNKYLPSLDEYIENGYISFALGPIVIPALYLVGPELSEEVMRSSEFQSLFKHMGTLGRLLNDIQGFKRESEAGKLNAMTLLRMQRGDNNKHEVVPAMKHIIEFHRAELLRLVLQQGKNDLPRACKDLFWNMSKILNLFYLKDDGFTSDDMLEVVKAVLHEPVNLVE
uniref:Ent-kaurene synthase n=1 Tax=Kalanchoe fedtschenkoi TaxID=63787 RepID=A0A7N0T996_KALFE